MCSGKCKSCAYYVLDSDSVACHTGTCHFLPPSVVFIPDRQEPVVAVWPVVCSDDFCGQWKSVEEVEDGEEGGDDQCFNCTFWDAKRGHDAIGLCQNSESKHHETIGSFWCQFFCRVR